MAQEQKTQSSDQPPAEALTIPSFHGSDVAPIISFDEVPFFGSLHGIGRLTLAAQVLSGGHGTKCSWRRRRSQDPKTKRQMAV
jgi:hypothetical protein